MRICIPTYGWNGLEDEVCEHFGRAPTYTIIDLETNNVEIIPNLGVHMGGGRRPAEILVSHKINVVVCSNLGRKALALLGQYGIKVYIGARGRVKDALNDWKAGKLMLATENTVCKEGHY